MKILVIEDEEKLASYLKKGLTSSGYITEVAHDGVTGLHLSLENDYALVVLDQMLPQLNGLSVLAALRVKKQTPVLMLTAKGRVEDRVLGLQSGADDYLVKPFAFSELLARIQVLLRRSGAVAGPQSAQHHLRIHDLEMDLAKRKVSRAGQRIELTPKEFLLLSLFLRKQGEVLSRIEIAEQVWDMNFDSNTNVVDVAVKRLRMKMDTEFDVTLIHTVRGIGYVLEVRQ